MIMNVFIQIAKMGCFSIPRYIIQYNFPRKKTTHSYTILTVITNSACSSLYSRNKSQTISNSPLLEDFFCRGKSYSYEDITYFNTRIQIIENKQTTYPAYHSPHPAIPISRKVYLCHQKIT